MGNQNHGKMIDCQPEKRLVELMDADEMRKFAEAMEQVKSKPNAWGKVILDIRDGKVKLAEYSGSIK